MMKINFKKGFTLLEALVAVSILMVAVMAPITIAQKGLSSAIYSKNQMIASYLAQDALEYVKNIRDENARTAGAGANWLDGLEDCMSPGSCNIDTIDGFIESFDNSVLKKDGNGFYGFEGGEDTIFTREIKIEITSNGQFPDGELSNEALVTAIVKWGSVDDQVEVKTLIYNY